VLGVANLHLGALNRAEQCFRETLAREPDNANARENLERVASAERGDGTEATEIKGARWLHRVRQHPAARGGVPLRRLRHAARVRRAVRLCGTEGMAVPPPRGAESRRSADLPHEHAHDARLGRALTRRPHYRVAPPDPACTSFKNGTSCLSNSFLDGSAMLGSLRA